MKLLSALTLFSILLVISQSSAFSQPGNQTLQEIEKRFDMLDKDKSGSITLDELPEYARPNFNQVDKDQDGKISKDESNKFFQNRPARPINSQPPKVPAGVTAIKDISYVKENPHERHKLDLYVPSDYKESVKKLPLVIWVHGGGWQNGSKDSCPALFLSTKGFAVASINYRLSQHAIFPAQINDCKAAIRFLRANAETYHFDESLIGVWGSSAGGHLVALLGTSGDIKELEGNLGNLDKSSRVQAVCDWYGPTDFLLMDAQATIPGPINHSSPNSPESKLLGGVPTEKKENARLASPISFVSQDDPPFLIMHGGKDPLVPVAQSEHLQNKLKEAKVNVEFTIFPDAPHSFGKEPSAHPMVETFFKKTLQVN
jgi:acetyl esterase/lipase